MKKYYVGVDIGGTTVKLGIFDSKKKLIDKYSIKTIITKKQAEKNLINSILDSIEEYCEKNKYGMKKNDIVGIGFTAPGPVVENRVVKAVNINWKHNFDIVKATKKRFGNRVGVRVMNDANAAAFGEYTRTLKQKESSICLLTLGTAVGAGVVVRRKLVEGHSGSAGELGHIKVDYSEDAIKCNCGNIGCLETVSSGRGIVNVYKRKYFKDKKLDKELEAKDIIKAAKRGDKKAMASLVESMYYLSVVIAILVHVYEPQVVLIGGGVSKEGSFITNILKKQVKKQIFITKRMPKIMVAKLKNDAGICGVVDKL